MLSFRECFSKLQGQVICFRSAKQMQGGEDTVLCPLTYMDSVAWNLGLVVAPQNVILASNIIIHISVKDFKVAP